MPRIATGSRYWASKLPNDMLHSQAASLAADIAGYQKLLDDGSSDPPTWALKGSIHALSIVLDNMSQEIEERREAAGRVEAAMATTQELIAAVMGVEPDASASAAPSR